MSEMHWTTTRFDIDLTKPRVMGIVNVTPDSFSDGGHFDQPNAALAHCEQLLTEGADILDIGGESSRPGAVSLPVDDEWRRLERVLPSALKLGVPISVDTCKPEIMRRALDMGVDIINDIRALGDGDARKIIIEHGQCGVCLMHMQGSPTTMQSQTDYANVVHAVQHFFREQLSILSEQGVAFSRLVLDPGVGFGKTPEQNLLLLRQQRDFLAMRLPLLVGWSRKSTLGHITGKPVEQRLAASLAAALLAVQHGAHIVRVHDVAETVDALKVWQAVDNSTPI